MGKPDPQESNQSLTVRDNRTGKVYTIPYVAHFGPYGGSVSKDATHLGLVLNEKTVC